MTHAAINDIRAKLTSQPSQAQAAYSAVLAEMAKPVSAAQDDKDYQEYLRQRDAKKIGDCSGADALHELISEIKVYGGDDQPGPLGVEITGRLNNLFAFVPQGHGVWGTMVAGEGLEPPTRGL